MTARREVIDETGERYVFYAPEINARVAEQVELERDLRRAVERAEIVTQLILDHLDPEAQ